MMNIQITCENCGSSVKILPSMEANFYKCDICQHEGNIHCTAEHVNGILKTCVVCERQDFYSQKDFNRKIGVMLFVVAAILSIFTYGASLIVLFLIDFFLFKKIPSVVACYKCNTLYRQIENLVEIKDFNHEMNDRIVYANHDFKGKGVES